MPVVLADGWPRGTLPAVPPAAGGGSVFVTVVIGSTRAIPGIWIGAEVAHRLLVGGRTPEPVVEAAIGPAVQVAVKIGLARAVGGITRVPINWIAVVAPGLLVWAGHAVDQAAEGLAKLVAPVVEFVRGTVMGDRCGGLVCVTDRPLVVPRALQPVVVAALGTAVLVAIVVEVVRVAVAGGIGISLDGVLVVALWLLDGADHSFHETAPGFSVFVAVVIQTKGAIVNNDIVRARCIAGGHRIGADQLVVVAALGAPVDVALVVGFVRTVVWVPRKSIDGVLIVTLRLLEGALCPVIKTTFRLSVFVTLVVESERAVVDDNIVVGVVHIDVVVFPNLAPGLLARAGESVTQATRRPSILVAIVIRRVCTVAGSHHV